MIAAIGIDIGGTNVQVALVDERGAVRTQVCLEVKGLPTADIFLSRLDIAIGDVLQSSAGLVVAGIGIGTPGANLEDGTIERASNLPWGKVGIVDFLSQAYAMPVYLTNDANLFAIGERLFGGARDMKDFAVVTLGTGVGAGIYCGGRLLLGRDGLAGELGHVVVDPGGRACQCGRKGCLERYTSANGLLRTAEELLNISKMTSELRKAPADRLTTKEIARAAFAGDTLAREVFEYTGTILGRALADLAAYFNPEAIFLAGGLASAGHVLFEPTISSFEKNLLSIYPAPIPVLPSSIPGDKAGVLGAAALVWDAQGAQKSIKLSTI